MNFSDIVKLYDKNHGIVGVDTDYSDTKNSHYSDMQKKLKKAFECVGISDLSWLKDANGKNYEFKDGEDEYIIHLIEMDTSPLFKEIRNKGLKHTDWYTSGSKEYYEDDDFYVEYLSEISSAPSQQKWTQKSFKKRNESQYFVNLRKPTAFIPRFA